MTSQENRESKARSAHPPPAEDQPPIVIVGSGPIGIRVLRELLRLDPEIPITIYGDEPWEPYDRVNLVGVLTGELNWADLGNLPPLPENNRVNRHHHNRILDIDRKARTVIDSHGKQQPYSFLVLATGSHTCIPDIPGVRLAGVYTFRNMSDVYGLLNQPSVGHRAVVLGGGVQGLEVACGLKKKGSQVWIVQNKRLMGRQLDEKASDLVLAHVQSLGIEVVLDRAQTILARKDETSNEVIAGVRLFGGREIECDCVVLATGVHPTIDLALNTGLRTGRGIRVNDYLQTSDPLIYAVGECAEHRGRVYGLVGPGFEQAAIAAQNIRGGKVKYRGSLALTQLKGVGLPAFSVSRLEVEPEEQKSLNYQCPNETIYRKLLLRRGRLSGIVAIGDWPDAWRVREAVLRGQWLWPWQQSRFRTTGNLWPEGSTPSVRDWPPSATVCNCVGASRGLLEQAMLHGYTTLDELKAHTNAGTMCGSCVALLTELVGQPAAPQLVEGERTLVIGSLLSLLLTLLIGLAPPLPVGDTVQGSWRLENLWLQGGWKQISGYALLSLFLIALLMSLRKRWGAFKLATYAGWRVIHVIVGALALTVLIAHTGLSLGHNLNFALALDFLLLMLLGAVTGGMTVLEGRRASPAARRWKNFWNWGHILSFWPLPILLVFHIVSVYYF